MGSSAIPSPRNKTVLLFIIGGYFTKPKPMAQGIHMRQALFPLQNKTGRGETRDPLCCMSSPLDYFIIAAATFLNAATSALMCSSVYVGCVQNEIVESAREFATLQLNFV